MAIAQALAVAFLMVEVAAAWYLMSKREAEEEARRIKEESKKAVPFRERRVAGEVVPIPKLEALVRSTFPQLVITPVIWAVVEALNEPQAFRLLLKVEEAVTVRLALLRILEEAKVLPERYRTSEILDEAPEETKPLLKWKARLSVADVEAV